MNPLFKISRDKTQADIKRLLLFTEMIEVKALLESATIVDRIEFSGISPKTILDKIEGLETRARLRDHHRDVPDDQVVSTWFKNWLHPKLAHAVPIPPADCRSRRASKQFMLHQYENGQQNYVYTVDQLKQWALGEAVEFISIAQAKQSRVDAVQEQVDALNPDQPSAVSVVVKEQSRIFEHDELPFGVKLSWCDPCNNGRNELKVCPSHDKWGLIESEHKQMIQELIDSGKLMEHEKTIWSSVLWLCNHNGITPTGGLHYPANPLYMASNKDTDGKRKGELYNDTPVIEISGFPHFLPVKFIDWVTNIPHNFMVFPVPVHHDKGEGEYEPTWTLGYLSQDSIGEECIYECSWHSAPFKGHAAKAMHQAEAFAAVINAGNYTISSRKTQIGKGKPHEFDRARRIAYWPDATEEQLQDKQAYMDRLPALIAELITHINTVGLTY